MSSPVQADFTRIRYAQVWEDADILVAALKPAPGKRMLSISSAGDNALALLSQGAKVVAIDLNPAQLFCLELRVAAYRHLQHGELLRLIGSRPGEDREELFARCRPDLSDDCRRFWDGHREDIRNGIGGAGKFERYFAAFRERVLPWIHSHATVDRLLEGGDVEKQTAFYASTWDSWRWRLLFRVFFSRFVMGRMGRDPAFFKHVEGSVSDRILERTKHALTQIDCASNPYLQWILTGTHTTALPYALRPENFDSIRNNLDGLTWKLSSIEDVLEDDQGGGFDGFNLSDIFEYVDEAHFHALLCKLDRAANPGARMAYWNMLVPRSRPPEMADIWEPRDEVAHELFLQDKAFFYSRFVIEERRARA
ncbi:MAG: DUF3419 family protein [Verrucomicrobiota bacterium]